MVRGGVGRYVKTFAGPYEVLPELLEAVSSVVAALVRGADLVSLEVAYVIGVVDDVVVPELVRALPEELEGGEVLPYDILDVLRPLPCGHCGEAHHAVLVHREGLTLVHAGAEEEGLRVGVGVEGPAAVDGTVDDLVPVHPERYEEVAHPVAAEAVLVVGHVVQ